VTGIAVRAIPDVTLNALMFGIGLRLGMAVGAHEDAVVRRIGMAVTAQLRIVVGNREPGVVEGGSCPTRRGMARLAGDGESRCRVIRICGSLIIRLVT